MDEAKTFQEARGLANMTAEELWCALKACWIDVYLDPSDIITHDSGNNFITRALQANVEPLEINCRQVPIEVTNRMSLLYRYHEQLPRDFNILRAECQSFSFDKALLATVKTLNSRNGPDGLVTTLFVFGTMPHLGTMNDNLNPDIAKHAAAVSKTTKLMSAYFVKRQVQDAKKTQNGPETTEVRGKPIDSCFFVYIDGGTTGTSKWTGPFVVLDIDDSSATLLRQFGPQTFRLSHLKRYFELSPTKQDLEDR